MKQELTKAVDRPKQVTQVMGICRSSFIDVQLSARSANAVCDHIEQLEAEIERILAASRYSADLCTQALADIKLKDAEMAALKEPLDRLKSSEAIEMKKENAALKARINLIEVCHNTAALDDLRKDAERLDWLDQQGEAYGVHEHEGNRWLIDGPFKSLRVAIDAAVAYEAQA